MKGISFLVNDRGERKAVVIDLAVHRELWEDIYDGVVARERENEPRESIETVREILRNANLSEEEES